MSIRNRILATVCAIDPFDAIEKEQIDFVKQWIASGAELFRIAKPDQPDTHLVSYFMVYDQEMDSYLLVDHKKAGLWLPPGGHVEIDEYPEETVRREAEEELGIKADFWMAHPLFLTVTKTVGAMGQHTDVSLWYVLKGKCGEDITFDADEFHQIDWFKSSAIPFEKSDPHMKRFITKAYENRCFV